MKNNLILVLIAFLFFSCSGTNITYRDKKTEPSKVKIDSVSNKNPVSISDTPKIKKNVLLGIDVLKKNDFKILQNKRVGLITNQTGVDRNLKSTIDILYESPLVNLVALFGPEHGVRGDVEGGFKIEKYIDSKTKLPVYSLYGQTKKPSEEILRNIDILVYDIQDIGVRSYTFISTMGLAMEAASENNIEFLVLDRPNPLGGEKIEGNLVESDYVSFISQFPIPYVYGLTCGELANYLYNEQLLNITKELKLSVVPMENWERKYRWKDTNLFWVPTSPHIPNYKSAIYYPMTGILGELRSAISIGVGYTLPFQIIGAEWIDGSNLAELLNDMHIPGLQFRSITYKPYYAFGKGKTLHGVQIYVKNYEKVNLTKTQFYIVKALIQLYPEKNIFKMASNSEIGMFNKGIGTDKVKNFLEKNMFNEALNYLDKDIDLYKKKIKKYFLY